MWLWTIERGADRHQNHPVKENWGGTAMVNRNRFQKSCSRSPYFVERSSRSWPCRRQEDSQGVGVYEGASKWETGKPEGIIQICEVYVEHLKGNEQKSSGQISFVVCV